MGVFGLELLFNSRLNKWDECTQAERVSLADAYPTEKHPHPGSRLAATTLLTKSSSWPRKEPAHPQSVSLFVILMASPKLRVLPEARFWEFLRKTVLLLKYPRTYTIWSRRPSQSGSIWKSSERTRTLNSDLSLLSPESTDSPATTATLSLFLPPGDTTPRRLTLLSEQSSVWEAFNELRISQSPNRQLQSQWTFGSDG